MMIAWQISDSENVNNQNEPIINKPYKCENRTNAKIVQKWKCRATLYVWYAYIEVCQKYMKLRYSYDEVIINWQLYKL